MNTYSLNMILFLFLSLSGGYLFASSEISADEVRKLFTGMTVEGERRQYENTATNKLINFAEKFVSYYAEDGTIKQQIGDKQKIGKWRVINSGELCIQWEGKEEDCAPVSKQGDVYKRVTTNKKGRLDFESRYLRFAPGNDNNL